VSQPDRSVGIDFAPPPPAERRYVRIGAAAIAVLLLGVLVVGVTQLLLR
jgi:hypothetical protein